MAYLSKFDPTLNDWRTNTNNTMNNDNFDDLWANLRAAVTEARTAKPKYIKMLAISPLPTVIDHTDIEVDGAGILMHRTGSLMRCYLTKDDALKLAVHIISIYA